MFTIVRKFRLTRGSLGEVARRVKDGFVPLLRELPGFRDYYLLDGGQDMLISIRVFDSADEVMAGNVRVAEGRTERAIAPTADGAGHEG